jgi:hypothetical protein
MRLIGVSNGEPGGAKYEAGSTIGLGASNPRTNSARRNRPIADAQAPAGAWWPADGGAGGTS